MSSIDTTYIQDSEVIVSLKLPSFLVDNGRDVNMAIQHLFSEDEVAFSQCTEDIQSSALDLIDIAFAKAKATARNAERLKHIKKTVMFALNIHSADHLFVRPGKNVNGSIELAQHNDAGDIDVESILSADVLLIAPLDYEFDAAHVTTIGEVDVTIASKNPNTAQQIGFWTGGTYFLSNGNSLLNCFMLDATKSIVLGGEVHQKVLKTKQDREVMMLVEDENGMETEIPV